MTAPTPENVTPTPDANTPTPTPAETQQAVQQAAATDNVENMTPQQFRDWMDSLPDKIADAIDVKIGERRAAAGGNSGGSTTPPPVDDPKSKGLFGGKSFGEWFFSDGK